MLFYILFNYTYFCLYTYDTILIIFIVLSFGSGLICHFPCMFPVWFSCHDPWICSAVLTPSVRCGAFECAHLAMSRAIDVWMQHPTQRFLTDSAGHSGSASASTSFPFLSIFNEFEAFLNWGKPKYRKPPFNIFQLCPTPTIFQILL